MNCQVQLICYTLATSMSKESVSSQHESPDPCGHIKFSVANFARSIRFYKDLFGQLGYPQVSDGKQAAGFVMPPGFGLWIAQAELPRHPYVHSAPGLHHFCMKAEVHQQVDDVHANLQEKNTLIIAPPRAYPQYTPDYYAVFFADPDGMKLEVAYY
jgi:glyoxylase I family protein